ncbi:hypothetical protein DPMN_085776 [Dreissena polymorpha]|uniref:Uncharacterized protein n=1 Tax=Dreissena polymorpha TaxID=45954 RepID=A0A9D4BKL0_DREPO|nr:hypothetical protein DPMN_085776 [Dreissena polymorpha]
MSKFHEDWAKNVSSRLFTCFHYIHIRKTAPLPGGHVFSLITTIFKLVRDIHITNAKNVTSREKDPPPGGHVFLPIQTIIELNCRIQLTQINQSQDEVHNLHKTRVLTRKNAPPPWRPYIIVMNLLTKFHEDWTINVASRVKNAPLLGSHVFQAKVTISELIQDIIGTNLLSKFQEDQKINVASRVLTRFYYSHIMKNAPPTGSHVFQPTGIIFELVQDIIGINFLTKFHEDQTINVASRVKNAPPLCSHVFQAKVTISELIQDIIRTNLLSKFHEDRKINVASRVLTRFYYSHIMNKGQNCHKTRFSL